MGKPMQRDVWLVQTDDFGGYDHVRLHGSYRLWVSRCDSGESGEERYAWEVRPVCGDYVVSGYAGFAEAAMMAALSMARRLQRGRK